MEKSWYFKCGSKNIRLYIPEHPLLQMISVIFAVFFVIDLLAGNILGALLMALFLALNTVEIK